MKKGDYKSSFQANAYDQFRFAGGLSLVDADEKKVLSGWISKIEKPNSIYLDLGAGTGRITEEILKHKHKKVIALDLSTSMLNVLKSRLNKKHANYKLQTIVARSDNTTLGSANVDIITSFHLFKHLKSIAPTLREAARILRHRGYIIFDVLNKKSLVALNMGTCFALDQKEISKELEKAGFKVSEVKYLHCLGESVYRYELPRNIAIVLDNITQHLNLGVGTKMLILAQRI